MLFAALDSGIASTGNLMHAVLWAIVLAPLVVPGVKRRPNPIVRPPLPLGPDAAQAAMPR